MVPKIMPGYIPRGNQFNGYSVIRYIVGRGRVVPTERPPSTGPGLGNDQDDPVIRFNLLRRRAGK